MKQFRKSISSKAFWMNSVKTNQATVDIKARAPVNDQIGLASQFGQTVGADTNGRLQTHLNILIHEEGIKNNEHI